MGGRATCGAAAGTGGGGAAAVSVMPFLQKTKTIAKTGSATKKRSFIVMDPSFHQDKLRALEGRMQIKTLRVADIELPPGHGAAARPRLRPVVELVAARPPASSPGSTPTTGGATTTPCSCSSTSSRTTGSACWPTPSSVRTYEAVIQSPRRLPRARRRWFEQCARHKLAGPVAYFSMEFGHPRVARRVLGRPRRPRGRPLQGGQRPRRAAGRCRPPLPLGLLPPDGRRRRLPAAHLSRTTTSRACRCCRWRRPAGGVLTVPVDLPGRVVQAAVWKAQVGRVPVLMLDTDIPLNDPADRPITGLLYVRGREMRLCQEIVLGIGGVRALRALGIRPVGLAHERRPRGLPRPGARAREGGPRRRPVRGAAGDGAQHGLHHPHAGARGERGVRARAGAEVPRARGRRTSAASPKAALVSAPRAGWQLQPDRARPSASRRASTA